MRKEKKKAKKEYKELRRLAAPEEEIQEHQYRWRKLVRIHNKLRIQEEEIRNIHQLVNNNNKFNKDPFSFIKENVTKGPKSKLKPKCDVKEAEKFFVWTGIAIRREVFS